MAEGAEQKNWEPPISAVLLPSPFPRVFSYQIPLPVHRRGEEAALCKELLQQAKSAWFQAGVNTSAGVRQSPALATNQT